MQFTYRTAGYLTLFVLLTASLITPPVKASDNEEGLVFDHHSGSEAKIDTFEYFMNLLNARRSHEEMEEARDGLKPYFRARVNYEEDKVPPYKLPELLTTFDGKPVEDAATWESVRRPELLRAFESLVHGRVPNFEYSPKFEVRSVDRNALGGKATRKQIAITVSESRPDLVIEVLIYLPNNVEGPVPAMMGYNFRGNHTVYDDPDIIMTDKWMRRGDNVGIVDHRSTEASRGTDIETWQVDQIMDRGYALVTIYYGDVEPDEYNRIQDGVRALTYGEDELPGRDEWGAIAAWSWGLSRVMDYLETDQDIDHTKVALLGHSRLGKTSLWAGATDERFAIIISIQSGCGGSSLSSRVFGELVGIVNTSFPHWFSHNYNMFNTLDEGLMLDQHMLMALAAPRPLYISSASDDRWADPKGEFLAAKHASPVYELYGKEGLPVSEMPEINQSVSGTVGYHVRDGRHSVREFDWKSYMDFADKHFKN